MKPKLYDPVKAKIGSILEKRRYVNKFIRKWGTTVIDNVEVLLPRNYYYNYGNMVSEDSREARLFKFLNTWTQLKDAKKDGIDRAWLFLNPAKNVELSDDILAYEINEYIENKKDKNNRLTLNLSLSANPIENDFSYDAGVDLDIPGLNNKQELIENVYLLDGKGDIVLEEVFITNPDGTKKSYTPKKYEGKKIDEKVFSYEETKNFLIANYDTLWKSYTLNNQTNEEITNAQYVNTLEGAISKSLSMLGLFTFSKEKIRVTEISKKVVAFVYKDFAVYNRIEYFMTIVLKDIQPITVDSEITKKVNTAITASYFQDNGSTEGISNPPTFIGNVNDFAIKNEFNKNAYESLTNFGFYNFGNKYTPLFNNNWWVSTPEGYALKKEVLTSNKYMNLTLRLSYLQGLLDSDYQQEKKGSSFWSFLLIIVAVVITIFTAGVAGPALATSLGVSAGFATLATVITMFSLIISLETLGAQLLGLTDIASDLSAFSKTIAPLVMVASVILAYQSVITFLTKAIEQGATFSLRSLVDKVIDWVKAKISNIDFSFIFKVADKGFEFYSKNQLKSLQSSVNEKQNTLQSQMQSKEQSKYSDIASDIARMAASPLALLGSNYQFDTPYEPVYGKYNIGCSCRTTVLGLMNEGAVTYVDNMI